MKAKCYSQLLIQTGIAIISIVIFISNAYAELTWARAYGGTNADFARRIQQTTDGGYILLANTYSFGAGYLDVWVIKLDYAGNVLWEKTYGGNDFDEGYDIQQTTD